MQEAQCQIALVPLSCVLPMANLIMAAILGEVAKEFDRARACVANTLVRSIIAYSCASGNAVFHALLSGGGAVEK